MRIGYITQKLTRAVTGMASDTDALQRRLADAVKHDLLQLKAEDFPAHLRSDFEYVLRETMKVEATGNEGRVEATTSGMPSAEAIQLIEKIVVLFREVAKVTEGS
jgi:hypothetical protein